MKFARNDATYLSLKLNDIASASVGLSGRTLRKLPFLAHALYAQPVNMCIWYLICTCTKQSLVILSGFKLIS